MKKDKSNDNSHPGHLLCAEFERRIPAHFNEVERAVAAGVFRGVAQAALFPVAPDDVGGNAAAMNCILAGRHLSEARLDGVAVAIGLIDFARAGVAAHRAEGLRYQLHGAFALGRMLISVGHEIL